MIGLFKYLDPSDTPTLAAAIVGACRTQGWASPTQPRYLNAVFRALLDFDADFNTLPGCSLDVVEQVFVTPEQRADVVELMLAVELLAQPISASQTASIESWAHALGIDNDNMKVVRETAMGSHRLAQADLYRHGYWGEMARSDPRFERLLEQYGTKAYAVTVEEDLREVARWQALQQCAPGSLGQAVWAFYTGHRFAFPGTVGAANVLTAQHDWIHVLIDYSPTGLGEIELGAFRMTSSRLRGANLSFLAELGFWQSGTIESVLTGWHRDAFSIDVPGGAERVADAMRRGRACTRDFYVDCDFFDFKDHSVEELRAAWNIVPKGVTDSPGWEAS